MSIDYILMKEQELVDSMRLCRRGAMAFGNKYGDEDYLEAYRKQFDELEEQYKIEMAKL